MGIRDAIQGNHQGSIRFAPNRFQHRFQGLERHFGAFAQNALVALALGPAIQALHGLPVHGHALGAGLLAQAGEALPHLGRQTQGLQLTSAQGLFAGVGTQVSH
ncbi:MAG: hypothetical protein BWY56_02480 [Acidobacteria bacterium ADurb.Bin340]|nr:MAG: hypothetical protein BWY56_02480 [Acidobacteria bacterium ADurb.Bin340]